MDAFSWLRFAFLLVPPRLLLGDYLKLPDRVVLGALNRAHNYAAAKAPCKGQTMLLDWNDVFNEDLKCFSGQAATFNRTVYQVSLSFSNHLHVLHAFIVSSTAEIMQHAADDGVFCCSIADYTHAYICCTWSIMDVKPFESITTKPCAFCPSGNCPRSFRDEKRRRITNVNLCSPSLTKGMIDRLQLSGDGSIIVKYLTC